MHTQFLEQLRSYIKSRYTESETAEELNHFAGGNVQCADRSKKYSRSKVSKQLSGKQRISRNELCYWEQLLDWEEEAIQDWKNLYPIYEYQYMLTQNERDKIEQIHEIFHSLQVLSLTKANRIYEHCEPYDDGVVDNANSIQIAIQTELIREFTNSEPSIDVLLPQSCNFYYDQIKQILSGTYEDKKISIRQILMFSDARMEQNKGEFELLKFLANIYYLIYINPNCYQFYYSYSKSRIADLDGLIYPYFICTSDCLIRISQHQRTAWISHNQSDIQIYREMFQKRLKLSTVNPLLCNFEGLPAFLKYFGQPDTFGSLCISFQPCFAYCLTSEEQLKNVLNLEVGKSLGMDEENYFNLIKDYIWRIKKIVSHSGNIVWGGGSVM